MKSRKQTIVRLMVETHRLIRTYAARKRVPLLSVFETALQPVVDAMRTPPDQEAVDPFPLLGRPLNSDDETSPFESWVESFERRRREGNSDRSSARVT